MSGIFGLENRTVTTSSRKVFGLSNKEIFGVDLYQAEIGRKIEGMFIKMLAGPNAVRKTLQNYLQEHGGTL